MVLASARCGAWRLVASRHVRMARLGLPVLRHSSSLQAPESVTTKNFITAIIEEDLQTCRHQGRVVTRFPPEPNGYLHLGHAKSINFNFGVAKQYGGVTHMRFDDTNPAKEEMEYVRSILDDVRWLVSGNTSPESDPWHGPVRHASDYFSTIYAAAEYLIKRGLAYVDELSSDQMREYRGSLTEPGRDSPYRNRSSEESLRLFREMRDGLHEEGRYLLRAKIDMRHPNLVMRDPPLYRIKREAHPITGTQWSIYPMYDFAHALSDALEGITHSLCTLEFAVHRPLYDWTVENVLPSGILPFSDAGDLPHQYEFSRLNVQYTVLSKRKLIQLVREQHVSGWDDPRMPTIVAMRRRGIPAEALRLFSHRVGISKAESNIDMSVLEDCVREVLDDSAPRTLAVLQPLKIVISNWSDMLESSSDSTATNRDFNEELQCEKCVAEIHPKREELGKRSLHFGQELFIDRSDFFDVGELQDQKPPKGYKRLLLGGTVRLKYGFVISCDAVQRDATGAVVSLTCRVDPRTKSGSGSSGSVEGVMKAKGVVNWISAQDAQKCEVRLYDRLFTVPSPGAGHEDGNFLRDINPHSLEVISDALVDKQLMSAAVGQTYQFERVGYFAIDTDSGNPTQRQRLVVNRVVTLKDTWGVVKNK